MNDRQSCRAPRSNKSDKQKSKSSTKDNTSQPKPNGNTDIHLAKVPKYQLYRWQFTLRSEVEPNELNLQDFVRKGGMTASAVAYELKLEARRLSSILNDISKEWYMQLEKGEGGTGYIHYQGCFSLKNKEYMAAVKNLLGRNDVHLESAKNWHALKAYCSKSDTRLDGPWSHETKWIKTIESLRPWQEKVVDIIVKPCDDDRKIHWFFDAEGNTGKTSLCKYLLINFGATVVNNGSFSDLAHTLPNDPKIVCFNLPRTLESRVNYSAIEAIKDGMIFSGKYDSHTKVFDSPHVIIMANFMPKLTALSIDRWVVHDLIKEIDEVPLMIESAHELI